MIDENYSKITPSDARNLQLLFGVTKHNTMFCEAKMGKHKCCKIIPTCSCGTYGYLFSPEEGSFFLFSTRNNCCEFLAHDGFNLQSPHRSLFKKLVCGAILLHDLE